MYFNQFLGACSTWKLVERLFTAIFNFFVKNQPKKTNLTWGVDKYHFFIVHFRPFFILGVNHWKRFKMNKKGWKRPKKSVSTSSQVLQAPESWSEYTTLISILLPLVSAPKNVLVSSLVKVWKNQLLKFVCKSRILKGNPLWPPKITQFSFNCALCIPADT